MRNGKRILLLGDSIIDNGVYVQPGEPDVAKQIGARLPQYRIERRALDGAVAADVLSSQLHDLGNDDTIILSVGGNDALANIELLNADERTTPRDLLVVFWKIREAFRADYAAALDGLITPKRRVLVFTIYNPSFEANGMTQDEQQAAEAAVSIFNDVIQSEALARSADILELRSLFDTPADYANPIEPSALGGQKIADAVGRWVEGAR